MDRFAELSVFIAVADMGDFTAAARLLDLTPSGVSKAMSRLEARVGIKLFVRLSNGIALTEEGAGFAAGARKALVALQEAEAFATKEPSGILRVSCLPSFAVHQLAPLMPRFQALYPLVRIEFVLSNDQRVLLDRHMDIAIVSGTLPDSTRVAKPFATSRWLVCAAPEYLMLHGTPKSEQELVGHCTLNFALQTDWNNWLSSGVGGGAPMHGAQAAFGSNQGDMLLALARAGTGLVRLAEYHVSADIAAGRLVEVPGLGSAENDALYMIYEKHRHMSLRVAAFIAFAEEHFSDLRAPWKRPAITSSA